MPTLWGERSVEFRVEEQIMDAAVVIVEIHVNIAFELRWRGDPDDQILALSIDGRGSDLVGACFEAKGAGIRVCLQRLYEGKHLAKRSWDDVQCIGDMRGA